MHAVSLKAEMCVSDWGILDGHFLSNGTSCSGPDCGYGVYAQTGVDVMMSMAGTCTIRSSIDLCRPPAHLRTFILAS
eukprot:SAG31_NODE_6551_length_1981_cov_0.868757_3_plen_77_part_00